MIVHEVNRDLLEEKYEKTDFKEECIVYFSLDNGKILSAILRFDS